VKAYKRILTKI